MSQAAYIVQLEAENALLKGEVSLLKEEVSLVKGQAEEMAIRLATMEQEMESLRLRKDSRNSHSPPSRDMVKRTRSLRAPSVRALGGQPGHPGSTLLMRREGDESEDLQSDYCSCCGTSLAGAGRLLVERRQVADFAPLVLRWKEWRQYERICPHCQHAQCPDFPPGVDNPLQYGPNLSAMSAYLHGYQYVPYGRLQRFFEQCCSAHLSQGTLRNILRRMAQKAQPAYEQLCQVVQKAPASGSDETAVQVNGNRQWVWVWQSPLVTVLCAAAGRGLEVVRKMFPEGLRGFLCSDRWPSQLASAAKGHQLCLAHLLRDLNYLGDLEKLDWAGRFKTLLCDALGLKKAKTAWLQTEERVGSIEKRCDELLAESLDAKKAPQTSVFQQSMNKHRASLFRFLYDPNIPPDNNASERAIRNLKVKLKVSGQFKTGQQDYCVLRSIIDSTLKNKGNVFEVFQELYFVKSVVAE